MFAIGISFLRFPILEQHSGTYSMPYRRLQIRGSVTAQIIKIQTWRCSRKPQTPEARSREIFSFEHHSVSYWKSLKCPSMKQVQAEYGARFHMLQRPSIFMPVCSTRRRVSTSHCPVEPSITFIAD